MEAIDGLVLVDVTLAVCLWALVAAAAGVFLVVFIWVKHIPLVGGGAYHAMESGVGDVQAYARHQLEADYKVLVLLLQILALSITQPLDWLVSVATHSLERLKWVAFTHVPAVARAIVAPFHAIAVRAEALALRAEHDATAGLRGIEAGIRSLEGDVRNDVATLEHDISTGLAAAKTAAEAAALAEIGKLLSPTVLRELAGVGTLAVTVAQVAEWAVAADLGCQNFAQLGQWLCGLDAGLLAAVLAGLSDALVLELIAKGGGSLDTILALPGDAFSALESLAESL